MTHEAWLIATIMALQDATGQDNMSKPIDPVDLVFRVLAIAGNIFAALGVVIGFLLSRYFSKVDRTAGERERARLAEDADRAKLRDILYESLKWFQGGTQNRSIGIAVVRTSWEMYPTFRNLWIEVLANQVIYLLAAQEQKPREHEQENLRRMMDILVHQKSLLDTNTHKALCETMERKANRKIADTGLPLTPELEDNLKSWLKTLCGT